jgi:hypothetical protein
MNGERQQATDGARRQFPDAQELERAMRRNAFRPSPRQTLSPGDDARGSNQTKDTSK